MKILKKLVRIYSLQTSLTLIFSTLFFLLYMIKIFPKSFYNMTTISYFWTSIMIFLSFLRNLQFSLIHHFSKQEKKGKNRWNTNKVCMQIKVENIIRYEYAYPVQCSHRCQQQGFDWTNRGLIISLYQNLIQNPQVLNLKGCYCLICPDEWLWDTIMMHVG